ncbi:MAG: hypothetical protein QOD80_1655 [Verrucomicrobiota bacterium]
MASRYRGLFPKACFGETPKQSRVTRALLEKNAAALSHKRNT